MSRNQCGWQLFHFMKVTLFREPPINRRITKLRTNSSYTYMYIYRNTAKFAQKQAHEPVLYQV